MSSEEKPGCRNIPIAVDTTISAKNRHEVARENEGAYPKMFIKVKSKSGSEDIYHSIFSKDLSEDIIHAVMRDLNETEEKKIQGIWKLKRFLKEKYQTWPEDDLLVAVLRNSKYNIKKSEVKLQKYLKFRKMIGMQLNKMDFKTITSLLDEMPFGILPYRDKQGKAIIYTRPIPQLDQYETDFAVVCIAAMLLFTLSFPLISATGISYIGECKYSSVYEIYTTLNYIRRLIPHLFDIPLRIRNIDLVNENVIVRWFCKAIRPIVPQKLIGRISFFGSSHEKLHKMYHPDILPEEFDGTLAPMNDIFYRKKLLEFMEKLRAESEYVTD